MKAKRKPRVAVKPNSVKRIGVSVDVKNMTTEELLQYVSKHNVLKLYKPSSQKTE